MRGGTWPLDPHRERKEKLEVAGIRQHAAKIDEQLGRGKEARKETMGREERRDDWTEGSGGA
eukprot:5064293-Pleurochrysis_carterae.AAC.1